MSSPSAEGMRMRLAEMDRALVERDLSAAMSFGSAMQVVLQGGKVSREAWGSADDYIFMRADVVHLHKADGSEHKLIVGSGDVAGTDWVEV